MPDIATVTAALGGIKTAVEIAQALRTAGSSIDQAEMKLKIADLMTALAESQMQLAEIQILLTDKEEEIKRLQAALNPDKPVVRDGDGYFEVDEDGNAIGYPYCSYCYELEGLLIHTSQDQTNRRQSICPHCKNAFRWQSRRLTKEEKEAAQNA